MRGGAERVTLWFLESNQGGRLQRKVNKSGVSNSFAALYPCLEQHSLRNGLPQMKEDAAIVLFSLGSVNRFQKVNFSLNPVFSLPVTPS